LNIVEKISKIFQQMDCFRECLGLEISRAKRRLDLQRKTVLSKDGPIWDLKVLPFILKGSGEKFGE